MSVLYEYNHPKDLLAKVVRDARRVHFSKSPENACDHLFNFCVTAHSLRDWCMKYLDIEPKTPEANKFHTACNTNDNLRYCRDIANSSKHFGLDKGKKSTVDEVNEKKSNNTAITLDGHILEDFDMESISAEIVLASGESKSAFMFLTGTVRAWIALFDKYSIERDDRSNPAQIVIDFLPIT
ncbi:MAG: hypothetical protein JEZ12_24810 [Desulfobacterium sp.]|nr:hypothetical protein [Desulfobacterium sp.]